MQGFDQIRVQRFKEDKEVELRKQQRQVQSSQRRNIPSMDRDWIQVSEVYKPTYNLDDIPELLAASQSSDDSLLLYAAQGFRKLLSVTLNTPIQQILDSGVLIRFLEWTQRHDFTQLQYEACWFLTNISAGNSSQTKTVIDKGAIPLLLKLLASPNETVREQAVWTLGNIAGDNSTCRDFILSYDGLTLVSQVATSTENQTMKKNAWWTVSNLCRGNPPPKFERIQIAIPVLAKAIQSNSTPELLSDCLQSISSISGSNPESIQAVIDSGIVPRVIELLNHFAHTVQLPALRIIGNIATGSDEQTQIIIDHHALPSVYSLLTSPKRTILKEAVWICSNISAGNNAQLKALFDAGVFSRVINLMEKGAPDIQREAVWTVCNAVAKSSPEQIDTLVRSNVIGNLCRYLKTQESVMYRSSDICLVTLQGLRSLLECGKLIYSIDGCNPFVALVEEAGGLKVLEDLQSHQNTQVYEKALGILLSYFEIEAEEHDVLLKEIKKCSKFSL